MLGNLVIKLMRVMEENRRTERNYRRNVLANLGDAVFVEASNGMTPLGTVIASLIWYLNPSRPLFHLSGPSLISPNSSPRFGQPKKWNVSVN